MSQSKVQVYYHLVWSTKKRWPFLEDPIKDKLYRHIRALAYKKGVKILAIGGMADHIHILIKTDGTIAPITFSGFIKSLTTKSINKKIESGEFFFWQRGNGVFSIHYSMVNRTIKYIKNQKKHHEEINLEEELIFLENL
ncbi:IS200/IS605 family transposase [Candidatus Dependentiae bacterium]|nr:IS200/IS605 family transposase [Candidatus Dependentiae bacterium]